MFLYENIRFLTAMCCVSTAYLYTPVKLSVLCQSEADWKLKALLLILYQLLTVGTNLAVL